MSDIVDAFTKKVDVFTTRAGEGETQQQAIVKEFQKPYDPYAEQGFFDPLIGPAQWWHEHVDVPVGATLKNAVEYAIPGIQEGERRAKELREQGYSDWEAKKQSYSESNPWQQFGLEILNPVYWLPVAGWGARGATLAGKGLTRVGMSTLGKGVTTAGAIPYQIELGVAKGIGKGVSTVVGKPVQAGIRRIPAVSRKLADMDEAYKALLPDYDISRITQEDLLGGTSPSRVAGLKEKIPTHSEYNKMVDNIELKLATPSLSKATAQAIGDVRGFGRIARPIIELGSRAVLIQDAMTRRFLAEEVASAYKNLDIADIPRRLLAIKPDVEDARRLAGVRSAVDLENAHPMWGTHNTGKLDDSIATKIPDTAKNAGKSRGLVDVLEDYKSYELTPAQFKWAETYHQIRREWVEFAQKAGYDPYKMFGDDLHIFRQGLGRLDDRGKVVYFEGKGGAGGIGKKPTTLKPRLYATQEEGIAAGVYYNPNIIENLQNEARMISKGLRDQRLVETALPFTKTPTQRISLILRKERDAAIQEVARRKKLVDNLNRASRGEKLPSATKRWLQREFNVEPTADDAKSFLPQARQLLREAQTVRDEVAARYTVAKRRVTEGGYDVTKDSILRHPAFNNRVIDKEVAESLNKALGLPSERAKGWMTVLDKTAAPVSRTLRTAIAALDLSAPFIQGLPVLGYAPDLWAKYTLRQIRWLFQPKNFSEWAIRPDIQQASNFWRQYGLASGSFEYFAGVGGIEKILSAGGRIRAGRGLTRQTYGRAELAFSAYGDACRLELAQALRPMARTEAELYEVANLCNIMTGTMTFAERGIPQVQQLAEQSLLFAPRYLRAGWMLIGNTMRGGITGEVARESLGHLMAGGAIYYYHLSKAMGQNPQFDPTKPGFMGLSIGDYNFSLSGFLPATMRFAGDIYESIDEGVEWGKKEGEGLQDYFARMRKDVPFLKYAYSKSSPVVGTLAEAMSGTNYFGEEMESTKDYAAWLSEKIMPIALQQQVTSRLQDEPTPDVAATMADIMGMMAYPKPAYQRSNEIKDIYSMKEHNVTWDELERDERRNLRTKYPDIEKYEKEARDGWVVGVEGKRQYEWNKQREIIEDQYQDLLLQANDNLNDGLYSGKDFRDKVDEAGAIRRAAYDTLEKSFPDVTSRLNNQEIEEGKEFDAALHDYKNMVWDNPELTERGIYDYQLAGQQKQLWQQKWGQEMWQRLQEYISQGHSDDPPMVQELRKAREVLKPYWEIRDYVLSSYSPEGAPFTLADLDKELEVMRNSTDPYTREYAERIAGQLGITAALSQVTQYQRAVREQNEQINYYYQLFYGSY